MRLPLLTVLPLALAACTVHGTAPPAPPGVPVASTAAPTPTASPAPAAAAATPSPGPSPPPTSAPSPTPTSTPTTAPTARPADLPAPVASARTGAMHGVVADEAGRPVQGAVVRVRSLDDGRPYDVTLPTIDGAWKVRDVPADLNVEISASRAGWTTRRQVVSFTIPETFDAYVAFGQPEDEVWPGRGADLNLSDYPEVERTEPADGTEGVEPAAVTLKLAFSEALDEATQGRVARAVRLWPADKTTGNTHAIDLARFANLDQGDGLKDQPLDFRPDAASEATGGVIDASPGGRARATWDPEGRTLTFAVEGALAAAHGVWGGAYQVGLVSDGTAFADAQGHALGTDHACLDALVAPAVRSLEREVRPGCQARGSHRL